MPCKTKGTTITSRTGGAVSTDRIRSSQTLLVPRLVFDPCTKSMRFTFTGVATVLQITRRVTTASNVSFQFNYPSEWSPRVVSTQIAQIGPFAIVCVPGEFTTMSGRRTRKTVGNVLCRDGNPFCTVVIAGLCNTYSDYITTPEEYKVNLARNRGTRRTGFLFLFFWGGGVFLRNGF